MAQSRPLFEPAVDRDEVTALGVCCADLSSLGLSRVGCVEYTFYCLRFGDY